MDNLVSNKNTKKEKKLFIKTYGCQMNVYDSNRMADVMLPFGYKLTEEMKEANMIILNTCHIREKAAEKLYSELGRINKAKKKLKQKSDDDLLIAVAGCVSQAEGDNIFKRAPFVDIVVGPQSYHNLPDMVSNILREGKQHSISLDFRDEEKFDLLPESRINSGVTAFVSIQEGCDKFCTFCVVPYTRGAEFSRPVGKILDEIKRLVDNGTKEITLLGQNVNAYHGEDESGKITNLGQLIKKIAKIDGLERIRYTTSHPRDMHEELYEVHASEYKLMPFLHLPVQSGSDKILKAMNRKHTRNDYFKIIEKLKIARPDIIFSSDFIVGFPSESEEDFLDTLDLVKQVRYGQCYSFKYSRRPGTPADIQADQIDEEIKSERLARLQNLLQQQQLECNQTFIGKTIPVLFDKIGEKISNQLIGRSPYMQSVCIDNLSLDNLNKTMNCKITKASQNSLGGVIV